MTADFSRVARAYRWMEYASFGTLLERVRFLRIPDLADCRRALVLGDGDGRFLARLLSTHPHLCVDSVDCSRGMIRLAQRRVASLGSNALQRVQWHHADARIWLPQESNYDLIVTHFFLDCFSTTELGRLIGRLLPHIVQGGRWINSDFAIPRNGWMRWPSWAIIRGLYAAFFLLAGLRTQHLPDDASALQNAGLVLQRRDTLAGGLLKSEMWRKPASPVKS